MDANRPEAPARDAKLAGAVVTPSPDVAVASEGERVSAPRCDGHRAPGRDDIHWFGHPLLPGVAAGPAVTELAQVVSSPSLDSPVGEQSEREAVTSSDRDCGVNARHLDGDIQG